MVLFGHGWHLIGALEQQNFEYLSDCISSVFKFDNGAYVSIDQLIPGYGYWIYVVEDCDIEF